MFSAINASLWDSSHCKSWSSHSASPPQCSWNNRSTTPPSDLWLLLRRLALSHRSYSRNTAQFPFYKLWHVNILSFRKRIFIKASDARVQLALRNLSWPLRRRSIRVIFYPVFIISTSLFGRLPSPFFLISFSAFSGLGSFFTRGFCCTFLALFCLRLSLTRLPTTPSVRPDRYAKGVACYSKHLFPAIPVYD